MSLSIVVVLPLMVAYHCGIVQGGSEVRNIAEVMMTWPFSLFGFGAAQALNAFVVIALLAALWKLQRSGPICLNFAVLMAAESAVYAVVMLKSIGFVAAAIEREAASVLAAGTGTGWQALLLSVGAGVYEELLFRFVLVGGGVLLLHKACMWDKRVAVIIALAISSLLFSAVHHVGSLGEEFHRFTFIFRAVAGAVLGVIYICRGLGIAVWTHALYNVFLLLIGA